MATQKKAPAKKAPVKKSPTRKSIPKKQMDFSPRDSAEKVVNIYLGVIGKSLDTIQDSISKTRKENDSRLKELEKRGAKLRKDLTKRFRNFEASDVVDDAKSQFSKLQDQVEEAMEDAKGRFSKLQDQVEEAVDSAKEKLGSSKGI